jgi:hypothetical protein
MAYSHSEHAISGRAIGVRRLPQRPLTSCLRLYRSAVLHMASARVVGVLPAGVSERVCIEEAVLVLMGAVICTQHTSKERVLIMHSRIVCVQTIQEPKGLPFVLNRTAPHRTTPHHTTPNQTTPHHTAPHRNAPHHTTSHRNAPQRTSTHLNAPQRSICTTEKLIITA